MLLTALVLAAQILAQAIQPVPRADANSQLAHQQLLEKARRGGIDVYFEGDSITRRWGTSDAAYREFLLNWRRNFFGWNAANFGWGADTVQNILWRLTNGELDGVQPRVIVLLAGTNNVGASPLLRRSGQARSGVDQKTVQEVAGGIRAILDVMRQKAPAATILVTGITPRRDRGMLPTIDAINGELASFADGRRVRYININAGLSGSDGALLDGVTVDGLHLSVTGYQIWADALKPIFTEILGPPATTDHAPPPTGDPSAK